MTDQELKQLLDSFPVSYRTAIFACQKCGRAELAVIDLGETMEQGKARFKRSHAPMCGAKTLHNA